MFQSPVSWQTGRTPLHWAILFSKNECAKLLVEKGGAADIPDEVRMTCLDEGKSLLFALALVIYLPLILELITRMCPQQWCGCQS